MIIIFTITAVIPIYGAEKSEVEHLINQTRKQLTKVIRKERTTLNALVTTQKELDRIQGRLGLIDSELGKAKTRLQRLEQGIIQAERRLKELENSKNIYREQLYERLVALYKYGLFSHIEILTQAQNFSDFVNRFELVGYFVRHDLAVIETLDKKAQEIDEERKQLVAQKEDILREKNRIGRLKNEHVVAKKRLSNNVVRREKELARLQTDRIELEKALDELERTSQELEKKIKDLQNRGGPVLGTGRIYWPLTGRISSRFGWRRHPVLKKRKYHSGIDIAAPSGTAIMASDHGVVLYSGWNGGYGKMLSIDHGNQISTVYAHCSQLLVKVGDKVAQGQRVAMVGTTGLSTGPHLHFEVRVNGKPDNPMKYLP
jgi:murein DD-endopeptidase MepM/ murein hydrolase activator NlpD